MAQKLSPKGAEFIRRHEGFVDHWYLDPVGVGTIGCGFTWRSTSFRTWWKLHKPGQPFAKGATMTRAEADDALRYLADQEYGAAVARFFGKKTPQHVFDGTVSPVYNLGPGSLKWKWAAAVKAGDLEEAAKRLRNTGITAKGRRLAGLVKRRAEEAELIQFGDYAIGSTSINDPLADGVLRRGERGKPVASLQRALTLRGHYAGAIDGIFGYGTEAAVIEFQRATGLTPDGYAGPATLGALQRPAAPSSAPSSPTRPPNARPAPSVAKRGTAGWIVTIVVAAAGVLAGLWPWLSSIIERIF